MRIVLTIDVESYSGDYTSEVYAQGLGLRTILDVVERHGIRATFFIEALGATRWGLHEVTSICKTLLEHRQDVQLHVHPSVARLEGFIDRDDVLWNQDVEAQCQVLQVGRKVLAECGVEVTAFRAGDLAANGDTLSAMRRSGIWVGSNRDLDTKSSIRSKVNNTFPVTNDISIRDGIMDVPVTAFRSPIAFLDGRYRHFEINALSFLEMRDGLMKAYRAGYSSVGILTHPGEFFRHTKRGVVPIRKNCRRLEQLLEFVTSRPEFKVCTISECAAMRPLPVKSPPEIKLFLPYTLLRVMEQGLDRVRGRLGR